MFCSKLWPLAVAAAMMLFLASPVRASDTGSVSGTVFQPDGTQVDGATVKVTGESLPGGRVSQTGDNGTYQIDYLLPGEYEVVVEKPGIGTSRRAAVVEIGKDTLIDFVIGMAVTEEITVTAAVPIVDVRSSEVSFNFKSDALNGLPIERTYRGLFQLIPGVADNRSLVGPTAGGSRQDNTYLIDGANITNPAFGLLGTEINELDIAEVNLKRAGISAEFGRTGGSVTNAVSRSGSNRFSGLARIDLLPEGFVNAYKLPDDLLDLGVKPGTFRDQVLTSELGPSVGMGGPILANRLFFYGSAKYFRQAKWGRFNRAGISLPDEVRKGQEFFGKLTAAPFASQQLTVSYRLRPNGVEPASLSSDTAPSLATTNENGSRIATVEWADFLTSRRSLSVRYLYTKEINEDEPATILGQQPKFDPSRLAAMGQYTDPTQANLIIGGKEYSNIQNYRRHELRSIFTQYLDIGTASHTLKAGFGYEFAEEELNRIGNGWGLITNQTQDGVPVLRARYFTDQPPQLGQGTTHSLFVQDEMTIPMRTSLNVGVLLTRDQFAQNLEGSGGCPSTVVLTGGAAVYESKGDTCNFLRFGFFDEVQPRLGISYQLRDAKADKVYANWGRYYNMDQKSTARSLAPSRIFQTQTFFDLAGNFLSTGPLASTTGKMIDPDIKPIYMDEVLVGYATPFAEKYSVEVFFMSRDMKRFIEDVPSRGGSAPDSGPFVAANLPCKRFAACQAVDAKRTYRAVTVDVRRRLADKWMSDLSYTWSRFEGNYDIDFATVGAFNTSSFIQDGPGTNVEDPNRFGPLFEDRPHVLKLFTTYEVNSRFSASGYFRVQSGTPWAARGRDWEGVTLNFLEASGSHRNPAWANLDLMGSYRIPLPARRMLSLEARLLNVFNNQTRLSTDAQQFLDLRRIQTPPYFAPYLDQNPFFGLGNSFAPPRRLQVAAVVTF